MGGERPLEISRRNCAQGEKILMIPLRPRFWD